MNRGISAIVSFIACLILSLLSSSPLTITGFLPSLSSTMVSNFLAIVVASFLFFASPLVFRLLFLPLEDWSCCYFLNVAFAHPFLLTYYSISYNDR